MNTKTIQQNLSRLGGVSEEFLDGIYWMEWTLLDWMQENDWPSGISASLMAEVLAKIVFQVQLLSMKKWNTNS